MIHKYKEFADWYNEPIEGLTSVRSDYLMFVESEYHAAWDAAWMIDDDVDLDQPATLEWVRGRDDWQEYYGNAIYGNNVLFNEHTSIVFGGEVIKMNATRRQVIAAENFAKEMECV